MTEPIEVNATVVDSEELVRVDFTPAEIRIDYDTVLSKVQAMIEPYQGLTEEQWLQINMKECKASRAHMNKIKKEISNSRKLIELTYTNPLKQFQDFCKNLTSMIDECNANVDSAIKLREQRERQARYQVLEDFFYEYCSDNGARALTENIQFDVLLKQNWLNKSYGETKAKNEITAAVDEIMASLNTLQNCELFDHDGAMIEFFATLSVTAALDYDKKRREDKEKLDALKAEREEVQQYREPEPVFEAPEPEPVPLEVYEQPQPFGVESEPTFDWQISINCTRSQLYQLRDVMVQMGLDPHARRVVS